ncbi:TPA: hypothetical protein VBX43_000898 [Streptococcus agalactiae]|nr:hypothetical protein [Streptococcus agalactiae]
MHILEELKQRRAILMRETKELDDQIKQAEMTLKGLKKAIIKQWLKRALGNLLRLTIWLSFFLARTAFFYYLCHQMSHFQVINFVFAVWLSCGSDFLYTEGKAWVQGIWERRKM